jgi:hypothetical protein
MVTFGFFPGQQLTNETPPPGYGGAAIRAGTLHESVFCSLSTWKLDDYVSNCVQTAQRMLRAATTDFFCTDLAEKGVGLLAIFPDGDDFIVEEWVVRRDKVRLDGHLLSLPSLKPSPANGSQWSVTRAEIEAFLKERR